MTKKSPKIKRISFYLLLLVMLLGAAQLILGGNIGANNQEMNLIDQEIAELEKENRLLIEKISFSSSLQVIQEKAIAQGFSTDFVMKDYRYDEVMALKK